MTIPGRSGDFPGARDLVGRLTLVWEPSPNLDVNLKVLAAAHEDVLRMMERGGLISIIGSENVFWSSDQAIVALENRGCRYCANDKPAIARPHAVAI